MLPVMILVKHNWSAQSAVSECATCFRMFPADRASFFRTFPFEQLTAGPMSESLNE